MLPPLACARGSGLVQPGFPFGQPQAEPTQLVERVRSSSGAFPADPKAVAARIPVLSVPARIQLGAAKRESGHSLPWDPPGIRPRPPSLGPPGPPRGNLAECWEPAPE